jgi:hypothetical protein
LESKRGNKIRKIKKRQQQQQKREQVTPHTHTHTHIRRMIVDIPTIIVIKWLVLGGIATWLAYGLVWNIRDRMKGVKIGNDNQD